MIRKLFKINPGILQIRVQGIHSARRVTQAPVETKDKDDQDVDFLYESSSDLSENERVEEARFVNEEKPKQSEPEESIMRDHIFDPDFREEENFIDQFGNRKSRF